MASGNNDMFKSQVLGHPAGLFVLFFTEMWERFSYYGMRGILVLFLVSSIGIGGWDWTSKEALALYGTYTAMVYLTPILGGFLADRYIGYRKAVIFGAIIMTMGHASMAMEFDHMFLYIGIGLLIIGNGLFKPNMTSIISHMYKDTPEKKDGAYTIFYMGVNAGAFLGILLCGYLGEKVSWSYGFGLAGIFMFFGMLQFYFAQKIFGDIGTTPNVEEREEPKLEFEGDRLNPFTTMDKVLIAVASLIGVTYVINSPMSKIGQINLLSFGGVDYQYHVILAGILIFLFLIFSRILRYPRQTRDRMFAIVIFAIFIICFWASFEQAGGSMTIFAKSFTGRVMSGGWATLFNVINIIITVVPIGIITWVLVLLFKQTFKKYFFSTILLSISFVIIWGIVFWMINRNLNSQAYEITYPAIETVTTNGEGEEETIFTPITESTQTGPNDKIVQHKTTITELEALEVGDKMNIIKVRKKFIYLNAEKLANTRRLTSENNKPSPIIQASVSAIKDSEIEIPASWFGILNSLFIIMFAPLFSKLWESRFNPTPATKYGLGLILLGIGFGALAFGSLSIPAGAQVATVSIIWLILAYLFHTLGELCLSPVSLSYISKLVPGRMIALMFGVWYIAIAIGNKTAGEMGGKIDEITSQYSMTTFFLIFTLIPVGLGIIAILLNAVIKRLMHGVS